MYCSASKFVSYIKRTLQKSKRARRSPLNNSFSAYLTLTFLILTFVAVRPSLGSGLALGGSLGPSFDSSTTRFAWSTFIFYKWDEMVLLGPEWSFQNQNSHQILGTAYIRLPLGRVLMPLVVGGIGLQTQSSPALAYRWAGGFDLKNGKRSSLLIYGGKERSFFGPAWFGRAGLLLEF